MHRPTATVDLAANDTPLPTSLYVLVVAPTLLGVAHHVDHLVRGNHLGWPVTPEVTAFTYSLAIYPLVAVGLWLSVTDRVGAGYWALLLTASGAILAMVHVGPWALEPPADVVGPYGDPMVGALALGVLVALLASVGVAGAYAAVLWRRGDR
jgi:multisubunit Na+/H+ antiporter MnhC subunit